MKTFLYVIACLFAASSGSEINFVSHPDSVNPGTTANLTIRCSVNDAVLSNPVIIGKRAVLARNVEYVTSIVISRTNRATGLNETVGSVTTFDLPTAMVNDAGLTVTGTTDSSYPGEDGYLELLWTNPTSEQFGTYFCEAFTLDTNTHPENFEAKLEIGLTTLSTDELLALITELQNRIDALEQQNNQTSTVVQPSMQLGNIRCAQGTHDYDIFFTPALSYVPQVYTAMAGTTSSDGFVYLPSVVNIDENGFTLRCTATKDTDILWLAA